VDNDRKEWGEYYGYFFDGLEEDVFSRIDGGCEAVAVDDCGRRFQERRAFGVQFGFGRSDDRFASGVQFAER
jgi:hypothetical protein